jgi:hypothetical protein
MGSSDNVLRKAIFDSLDVAWAAGLFRWGHLWSASKSYSSKGPKSEGFTYLKLRSLLGPAEESTLESTSLISRSKAFKKTSPWVSASCLWDQCLQISWICTSWSLEGSSKNSPSGRDSEEMYSKFTSLERVVHGTAAALLFVNWP